MKRREAAHDAVFREQEFAGRYARKHQKMALKFGREYDRKLRAVQFRTGRILDAGCGFGGTLMHLIQNFPEAEGIGIDLSRPLLDLAKASAEESDLNSRINFKEADVHQMPFPDNYFDVILNINMVHLVKDPVRMLNETERVLAPNGYFFVADIRRSWIGYLEQEFKSALAADEAAVLIQKSMLRAGSITPGLLWWRYENAAV